MSAGRTRRGGEEGQASVELALLLPLVVLLLLAILQVGLLARDVVLVSHASRVGAWAAATDLRPGAAAAAARDSSGLDADRMEVSVAGTRTPGGRVRVTVTYRAATDVPLIGGLLGDPTMRSSTTMRVEGPASETGRTGRTGGPNGPFPAQWGCVAGSRPVTANPHGEWTSRRGARSLDCGGIPSLIAPPPAATQAAGPAATFWRIHRTCSSARLPPSPAEPCWRS